MAQLDMSLFFCCCDKYSSSRTPPMLVTFCKSNVHILCNRTISVPNVKLADSYLVLFCKEFEKLYRSQYCTPNMHLHLHLNDCILDYGPVYSYWCFAFERYNGMLGSYPTNSRQIEPQIMNIYIQQRQIHGVQIPQQCSSFSEAQLKDTHWTGSLLQSVSPHSNSVLRILNLSQFDIGSCDYRVSQEDNNDFIPPIKQYVLPCGGRNHGWCLHEYTEQ